MKKILRISLVYLVALAVVSPAALAQQETSTEEGKAIEGITNDSHVDGDDRAPIYWDFIMCTHSSHECSHEAYYHGYYHYRAVYHPQHCGYHTPYECYGGHHK